MFCKFTCFCIPKWQATAGAYMLIQARWSTLRIGRVNISIYSAQFSLKCYIILKVLLRVNSGWAHHMTSIQWDVRDLARENRHCHGHGGWLRRCWLLGDPLACHWHSKHWRASILARLINTRCAIRFPLIMEIFVLSDDKTTPSVVAPGGSASWMINNIRFLKSKSENAPGCSMRGLRSTIHHKPDIFLRQMSRPSLVQMIYEVRKAGGWEAIVGTRSNRDKRGEEAAL